VRGAASSFMGSAPSSSSAHATPVKAQRGPTRISAVKTPEECNEEECAPPKEVTHIGLPLFFLLPVFAYLECGD
jgi:hypothetical protein